MYESTFSKPTAFATTATLPFAAVSASREIPFVTSTGAFVGTTVASGSTVGTGAFVGLGARVVTGVGAGVMLGSTYFSTVVVDIVRLFLTVESFSLPYEIPHFSCNDTSNESLTELGREISNLPSTPSDGTSTAVAVATEYP